MNKALFIKLHRNSYASIKTKRNISTNNNKIDGIYPPICTPFLPLKNEPIAWKHLENNLNIWEKIPFKGNICGQISSKLVVFFLCFS